MASASQPEDAGGTLRRLIAEHGTSTRKLSKTIDAMGHKLGASSIGNIARRDDRASPETLALLARALGEPPEVFLEYRLARARRLLDEREVGLDAAAENYMLIEDAFAGLLSVGSRLAEADQELADQVAALLRDRRQQLLEEAQAEGQRSTADGDSQPPAARSGRARSRQDRRPA